MISTDTRFALTTPSRSVLILQHPANIWADPTIAAVDVVEVAAAAASTVIRVVATRTVMDTEEGTPADDDPRLLLATGVLLHLVAIATVAVLVRTNPLVYMLPFPLNLSILSPHSHFWSPTPIVHLFGLFICNKVQ